MLRPCFLVVDREHSGAISTRKLVIEPPSSTSSPLTAAARPSNAQGLPRHPRHRLQFHHRRRSLRGPHPPPQRDARGLTVIVVAGPGQSRCEGPDYFLDSFDPGRLIELIRTLQPVEAALIDRQNEDLAN